MLKNFFKNYDICNFMYKNLCNFKMNKKIELVIIINLCYIEIFLLNVKIPCMYTIEK